MSLCRLNYGDIWEDPIQGHRVGVLDATKIEDVKQIMGNEKAKLIINDPPYNVRVRNVNTYKKTRTLQENGQNWLAMEKSISRNRSGKDSLKWP